jgi:glycosyltransferase involved in cell wall biosynthesis
MPLFVETSSSTLFLAQMPNQMKPLRIAITSDSYPPYISGVSVFAQRLAQGLIAAGHEVIVCCPSPKGTPYRGVLAGVPVYRFRSVRSPWRRNYRNVVGQQRSIAKVLADFKPDIIHAQDPNGCSSAAMRYAEKHGVPVIGTYHFSLKLVMAYIPLVEYFPTGAQALINAWVNDFYNGCAVITCPTETSRTELMTQGLLPEIIAISNGIDMSLPLSELPPREPSGRTQLLSVGRIDDDKNVPLLLRTMQALVEKHPVHLTIVGAGNRLKYCKRWVREHGLAGSITFAGALAPGSEKLLNAFARTDIFVTPSLIETQGLVVMEAMLAALPVVAPNSGALPELIQNGVTGYLVNSPTPTTFAAAIGKLITSPEDVPKMGLAGRNAIAEHSFDLVLERFVSLYRKVL